MSNAVIAFSLTLFAGLSTGIGSLVALVAKRTHPRFLAASLGFSAGVMIYVSFVEIFRKAQTVLVEAWGHRTGNWATVGAFFAGVAFIALVDRLVPEAENPHEARGPEDMVAGSPLPRARLLRLGLLSAFAIGIHNFPEGLATFLAALQDPKLGLPVAVAVAIHNIPEGIAVSVPVYYATGSRKQAFAYSFLSGLAEPVGALLGFALLHPFLTPTTSGLLFGAVAGIMVFISLDELLPTAQRYGEHHVAIDGLLAGMGLMALSLLLFL